jgi:uncharacterized SAM-binding protein YcdF (DUF218 family)
VADGLYQRSDDRLSGCQNQPLCSLLSLASLDRRRRLIFRWIVAIGLLLVVAVVAGVPVYVRPQIDPLRHADAIFILGGPEYDRYPYGFKLGEEGWAPIVVASNPNGPRDPWLTDFCATPHRMLNLRCFVADSPRTKGEGRVLRRLATEYGWRTVIVVTFRPHISRARYILQQCFDGGLIMTASPTDLSVARWAFEYVYQTAGYVRAALEPGC